MNDPGQYEFFGGRDDAGSPLWTKDFSKIRPLAEWNNRCGCVTMTYNPGLKKYLMCITDGWPTCRTMDTYILESDRITGPWKMAVFLKNFGEQAYFVNIPSKFIGKDGRKAWLSYSCNFTRNRRVNPPGGRYGMCLYEIEFLDDRGADALSKAPKTPGRDPLESERNIAGQARVDASSTYEGYSATAVVDGHVGGYPDDLSAEWASNGEKAGARIRLTWAEPKVVEKIWLFDRPNTHADRVLAGRLRFSDGTTLATGALPDDAAAALQVTFTPRKVTWIEFKVASAKPETLNIGLAEIAVFEKEDGS